MLTVNAPAKLNLTLEILGKRSDGFHEIRSVMQTINLCDLLCFQLSRDVTYKSDSPKWIAEDSLVSRTVRLVQQTTGCSKGVTIEVSKQIPLASGLGGDSSDAAATLRGLNKLWELGLSQEKLLDLARQLGSDVAFFLTGGTALAEGRGEIITPLAPFPHMWVVLAMPPVARIPGKTKQLYDSIDANHYTDGKITRALVGVLMQGRGFTPSLLFNIFENVVFNKFSEVKRSRDLILSTGMTDVHLAGSGPTLFTLLEDRAQAESLCTNLQKQNLTSHLTDTLTAIPKLE